MSDPPAQFLPLGESALQVTTPLARELLADLSASPLPGVLEAVPALNVLTILYQPLQLSRAGLQQQLLIRLQHVQPQQQPPGTELVLRVQFDGPDLGFCAEHAGLTEANFVAALCGVQLEVAFLGFTPGFAFLTGLPTPLQMPRLATPRSQVPAGSVALGGPWAGVYPSATAGGWRIVGQTQASLFDLSRSRPLLWQPGDQVRFARADFRHDSHD